MGITRAEHRPLVSGLRVRSFTGTRCDLTEVRSGSGTLTGMATRNSDDRKRVLVTNLHVMAGCKNPLGEGG